MSDSDICGATAKSTGEPCRRPSGWGTQNDDGRCKFHGGAGSGNPDAEGAAIKHGARADPTNLYEHLGDEATEWVDKKVEAYLGRKGLEPDTPEADLVELAVITMYQARSGHAQLAREGLSRTSVVGTSEGGRPITDEEEHYLNRVVSRHSTDARMLLKDAGSLDDPESQKADAIGDLGDGARLVFGGDSE